MVLLFYTTYTSVDLAHHEIYHAKVGKGGIKEVLRICDKYQNSRVLTMISTLIATFTINVIWLRICI